MSGKTETLGEGRFLRLQNRNGWEFVERVGVTEVAVLIAVTESDELVLVEQYREPVRAKMIELPAGLVGDEAAFRGESLLDAANRELEEETGYRAGRLSIAAKTPSSGGMTSEIVTFVHAAELTKVGPGGGVEGEDIRVHTVPLDAVDIRLQGHAAEGRRIDPKIYAGLRLLTHTIGGRGA